MATIRGSSYVQRYTDVGCNFSLTVTADTQSIAENYTNVKYSYSCTHTGNGWSGTARPNAGYLQVVINGSTVVNVAAPLNTSSYNDGANIASGGGTVKVYHNDDGTKTLSYSISMVTGTDQNNYQCVWVASSKSGSMTLNTIPRATQPSMSASSVTMGNSITINTPRAASAFTHSLWYQVNGGAWQSIATGVGTSYSWTVPVGLASNVPNGTSIGVTIICRTFNGSTNLGDKTTSFTANVPSSVVPSMGTPTATRVDNGVPSGWGVYVKGYSKVTIAMTSVSGSYGSTIKSYSISGPNLSSTSSSATSGVLGSAGTNTYTCTITDSRGRTASKTVSISVVDYSKPSISVSASRCNSDGTISSSGTYLKVTATYSIASVSSKNSVSSRSVTCNSKSNTSFSSGTAFVLAASCAINTSYTLTASVTDVLGNSASASVTIPTASRIMNVRANKTGVAFGKFAESDNLLDVAWPTSIRSSLTVNGTFYTGGLFGTNKLMAGNGNSAAYLRIATITVSGTFQNYPIEIRYFQRGARTPVSLYIYFSSGNTTDPGLATFYYEGYCVGAYIAKVATSTWDVFLTKSEAWDGVGVQYYAFKSDNAFSVTYRGENYTSLPSGYTKATPIYLCTGQGVVEGNNISATNGYLYSTSNDKEIKIGSENSSYCHYVTTAPNHWFNKPVYVAGNVYGGSSYNRRLAYLDEVLPLSGGTMTGNIVMGSGKQVIGGILGWGYTEGNGIYGFADGATYLEIRTASHGATGIYWWDSDASLKKNIKNTEVRYALEKIAQLHHVEFDWKENNSHVDLGYVADDVEKVLPCLVFGVAQYGEDGKPNGESIKNIDYRTMIPLITMGMQELIEERDLLWSFDEEAANCIIQLREEVDELKQKNELLTQKTTKLETELSEMRAELEALKQSLAK